MHLQKLLPFLPHSFQINGALKILELEALSQFLSSSSHCKKEKGGEGVSEAPHLLPARFLIHPSSRYSPAAAPEPYHKARPGTRREGKQRISGKASGTWVVGTPDLLSEALGKHSTSIQLAPLAVRS